MSTEPHLGAESQAASDAAADDLDTLLRDLPALEWPAADDLPPRHEGAAFWMHGREWIVPCLDLGQARRLQPYVETMPNLPLPRQIERMTRVALVALQRNYPTLTLAHVERMIDVGNIFQLFESIMGQSGFRERRTRQAASP